VLLSVNISEEMNTVFKAVIRVTVYVKTAHLEEDTAKFCDDMEAELSLVVSSQSASEGI
jgi:hypothetical protein